jgi:light-regulated signal transduction histidine kinase (bacteriophytochrome)
MADALQQHQKQNERFQAELEQRVQERTAQLEQSNKELEAFSYSVSHDLRAPLRHIHGYVDILHSEPTTRWTPEQHRLLQSVSDAAKRMGKLIDDLLAFSRMSRAELKKTEIATEQLVREVIGEMTRDLDGRDVAWTIERLPPIWADRALLKQVWTNLLSNALKFTRHRPRAEIRISSRPLGDEWEFCIQDNGAGFDMSYADKLFSVFTRLHRLEEYEGTGIGLANVHRIILRHGGRTWAEGKVDAGAKFYFSLPAVREL